MVRRIVVAAIILGVALMVIFVGLISTNEPFGFISNTEEIEIPNIVYVSASNTVLVTVEYQGSRFSNIPSNATIIEAFLNGTEVTSNWASSKGTFTVSKGESTVIALIVPSLTQGEEYSVKLVTARGTTCNSSIRV
jgi:archaellum component FlaF (FlaF/FlaG flagellin family)